MSHPGTRIMDAESIRRAITRIAHEILERQKGVGDLVLIGIIQRGDLLAQRLASQIQAIEGTAPPVGALDITFHRDDTQQVRASAPSPAVRASHLPFDLNGKRVVLVDDVLYTGRSVRAALDELNDYGRPQQIQLAVLVDRGHRELPIHADFVGKNVPTARREQVAVHLREHGDPEDAIWLIKPEEGATRGTGA